jgi:predicted dehydrogenase
MPDTLRALILGSGYAGQGHALALRDAGVEIVGITGRTRSVVERVAATLDIPHASTDWKQALAELQPDIAAVGTPGGVHFEPVMATLAQGCHIYFDKPLAATATASQARAMFQEAQKRGVKTAYTASFRYQPYAFLFKHSGLQPHFADDYIAFYGDEAAIFIKGHYAQGALYLRLRNGEWQEIPLPTHITDTLPNIEDDTQRNWPQLAREFVADIRGQEKTEYQTFKDGWIYQAVIEAIRAGQGWVDVPNNL